MSDIQVVYIITKLELGGAQKVCLTLFEGMQQAGLSSTLISGTQGTLVGEVQDNKHVILIDSIKREVSFRHILAEIRNFIKLIQTLKQFKSLHPHLLIHTHSTKAGIIGRWAAFFAGIKKRIHTIHGYGFHDHQSTLVWITIFTLEWLTSLITTHFICVSSKDVQTGLRFFPHFDKKNSIIRAAVEWEQSYIPATRSNALTTQKIIFGTIACFKPQKNIFDLLKAFEMVYHKHSNVHLEIIGDGALRPAIEQWISEHRLSEVITLYGWQKNIFPIMQKWYAFALTSLWEGLPCAIIEARLMKLPVVCYDTGGIHDVIFDHENGLLYRQGNWRGLAQGMISLIKEKSLYEKLRSYNEELEEFKKSYMIQEHIQLYKKLTYNTCTRNADSV